MMALRLEIGTPAGGAFQILLEPGEVDLGRSAACAVRLPYPAVSSRHLRLREHAGRWEVTDLGSKNGTLLDGRPLPAHESVRLPDGAVLQISDVMITATMTEETHEGFTLTESGTMLRKLVAESATDTGAYLTAGKDRVEVPDFASALRPTDTASFSIDRRGHGFWLSSVGDVVVDSQPVGPDGVILMDGSTIEADGVTWTFRDPLQPMVEGLDDEEPLTVQHAPVRPSRPVDSVLLGVAIVTALLSIVGLLVIFEVV